MKSFLIAVIFLLACSALHAQSFVKPVAHIKKPVYGFYRALTPGVVAVDSVKNLLRPTVSGAAAFYSSGQSSAVVGAGVAYQHLNYAASADRWTVLWSIGAYAWYNTPLPSGQSTNTRPVSVGAAAQLFDGLILVGVATNFKQIGPVLGININLNN